MLNIKMWYKVTPPYGWLFHDESSYKILLLDRQSVNYYLSNYFKVSLC